MDAGAADVLLAHGALWVANKSALSVMQIDPLAERVTGTVSVGDGPGSLAATRDAIWVTNEYDGTVSRIDPKAKAVVRTYAVGASPHGIAVAGKDLWLTSTAFTIASHRGGTLTFIAADSEFLDDVDPAIEANPEVAIVARGVYDGLVAHRATAGAAGVALVPDLAVALPTPENGGRTYTFRIRKDIRYSNGDPVNASDFQRGLVRELTVGQDGGYPDLYSAIIGAPACIADPKDCDLNAGVTVDNHARLITFHLSHADPSFLDKLTQLVVATPTGAPSGKAVKPIPSTGPYQISKFVKGQLIELQRNPYFKQWSYAAQPDGYPETIRYVKGRSVKGGFSAEQAGDRADIIAGRADVMRSFIDDEATNKQLHARYGTQLHDQVRFDTQYLTLNVNIPPFNNRDARRAINYAVDRKKLAQTYGGESAAHPTCQVLPPGFPGYVAYCPYPLDIARAKSLVAASGTAGTTVDFYGRPMTRRDSPMSPRY